MSITSTGTRSWVEVSARALRHNVAALRAMIGSERVLCVVVKANAYGHGMIEVARVISEERAFSGRGPVPRSVDADRREVGWFGVDSLPEALAIRAVGIETPMIILGYVPITDARAAVRARVRVTVAEPATMRALSAVAGRRVVRVHVKLETGTQRQGVAPEALPAFLRIVRRLPGIWVEGVSTHLADVEDTGPDGFAAVQLAAFDRAAAIAEQMCGRRLLRHASATAATMLLAEGRHDFVRPGIGCYGLWPSDRTRAVMERRDPSARLFPVLKWKTMVGPLHEVPTGAPIGYGCTERVSRRTRIAVLPVGYWDGYDRKLSSTGEVLIRGRRCKVLGRICMNMCMVDVTDVPRVRLEDEVVLLGKQGRAEVTAEELAGKVGTINYEVVTRINPLLPRRVV
ncbi:alanine racemase [Candidatus Uhrbacteria bacterium]|nr:alanine racemase [Candidatus Uhrbacteria bacterium]